MIVVHSVNIMVAILLVEEVIHRKNEAVTGVVGDQVPLGVDAEDGISACGRFEGIQAILTGGEFRSAPHCQPRVTVGSAERILEERQRTQIYNGEGAASQLKAPIRSSVWVEESVAISISIGLPIPAA